MSERWLLAGGQRVRSSCCGASFLTTTDGSASILPITPECCRKSVTEARVKARNKLTRTWERDPKNNVKLLRTTPESLPRRA